VAAVEKIKIGVSDCLLGKPVRYDGQHKHDHYITDTLGRYFEFVGVCPEVECGLGVPRESMRLVGDPEHPTLLTTRTGIDHTDRLQKWATRRVAELEKEGLHGFIFKSRSPSSGMANVKVYNDKGGVTGRSPGLFAKAFMIHFPDLPCEDEGRLNDPDLRENFVERVFTLWRFRKAMIAAPTLSSLMTFHARNKYLIQAHHESIMREMGRALAALNPRQARAHIPVYEADLMRALKHPATVRKHANILQHMLGFLRELVDDADRKELTALIGQYQEGLIPLIVPVTMLRHYVVKHDIQYLKDQYYLDPHPLELKLRNHA
jgi:uncharacterized protein YbgA (DUF1722 family)/uncharacterized protein YbbK (DUF523 family)